MPKISRERLAQQAIWLAARTELHLATVTPCLTSHTSLVLLTVAARLSVESEYKGAQTSSSLSMENGHHSNFVPPLLRITYLVFCALLLDQMDERG